MMIDHPHSLIAPFFSSRLTGLHNAGTIHRYTYAGQVLSSCQTEVGHPGFVKSVGGSHGKTAVFEPSMRKMQISAC